tara:strand:+ start:339 stop:509 length:171 start_codon:yes stop_codon:yes gene_type:complete
VFCGNNFENLLRKGDATGEDKDEADEWLIFNDGTKERKVTTNKKKDNVCRTGNQWV